MFPLSAHPGESRDLKRQTKMIMAFYVYIVTNKKYGVLYTE